MGVKNDGGNPAAEEAAQGNHATYAVQMCQDDVAPQMERRAMMVMESSSKILKGR